MLNLFLYWFIPNKKKILGQSDLENSTPIRLYSCVTGVAALQHKCFTAV